MFFPIFIDIKDFKVLVIDFGNIAYRRIKVLLEFGADIKVITKQAKYNIDNIDVIIKEYNDSHITNEYNMVIAATDNKDVNKSIIEKAKQENIKYYNNISDKSMSNFYFPAVITNEDIVCGIISQDGKNHKAAKEYSIKLKEIL